MEGLDRLSQLAGDVLAGNGVVQTDGIEVDLSIPFAPPQPETPENMGKDFGVSERKVQSETQETADDQLDKRKNTKNAKRSAERKTAGLPTANAITDAHTTPQPGTKSMRNNPADPSVVEPSKKNEVASTADARATSTSPQFQPLIIGLYGISGVGKSHALQQLSNTRLKEKFDFVDGSALIDKYFGLAAFKQLSAEEQREKRIQVMSRLVEDRRSTHKGIVVSGHLLFWNDATRPPRNVGIDADWKTYTHTIYLQVDPKKVQTRRKDDKTRDRSAISIGHLERWQACERALLRDICYKHDIVFTTITGLASSPDTYVRDQLMGLLRDFLYMTENTNLIEVDTAVDKVISQLEGAVDTMLVLDADKTLAPQDTGLLFWKFMKRRKGRQEDTLHRILSRGYSYKSFLQVAFAYDETADDMDYMCSQVAIAVRLYPEMAALLARVATEPHVGAIIVTSGLRKVWEKVLLVAGLTHVKVIGNGRRDNAYVVTDTVKGHIVGRLKEQNLRIIAFGDSPLDIQMLRKADDAYVIVGEKQTRSVSMDSELLKLIQEGCSPRQVLLPASITVPRLTEDQLPLVKLDHAVLNDIFRRSFIHATHKTTANLLMTSMRDASTRGHDLRKAHAEVGYYLANEYLGRILGIEPYPIKLVTDEDGEGFRVRDENKTLIIPLMRGGEPLALGVSKALKQAAFVHSKRFEDIDESHFEGKKTIILVDSVVNSGKSIVEYLVPLRAKLSEVNIVVVAGVVQEEAVKVVEEGTLGYHLRKDRDLTLVALRTSVRKFTGKGTTDTGHRLFNTTYLD